VNVSSSVSSSSSLTPAEAFVLGAISKMVATVVTYPLQLAQVLLRLQSSTTNDTDNFDRGSSNDETNDQPSPPPPSSNNNNNNNNNKNAKGYKGMIDCLHQQFLQDGIPGLFQGMNAKLLSTVLTAAFTFLSYEQTLLLVGKLYREVRLLKSV
jgi:adenine nucleotide transporter 17